LNFLRDLDPGGKTRRRISFTSFRMTSKSRDDIRRWTEFQLASDSAETIRKKIGQRGSDYKTNYVAVGHAETD
jgi:hypothetical protein